MTTPFSRRGAGSAALLSLVLLAGCATQSRNIERLPFHVAIAPAIVNVDAQMTSQRREGDATAMVLAIDAAKVSAQLAQSMSTTFMRVSMLPGNAGESVSTKDWASKAQALGADLLLQPELTYAPTVHSELNDRFWLNLPLFAIGGPLSWFVSDRSYYCDTELAGNLVDVSVAMAVDMSTGSIDDDARVIEITSPATEASLNFLDRADGAMPFLMSLVVPAGLIASESNAATGALDGSIVTQVSASMAKGLLDRGNTITRWRGVSFHPRDLQVQVVNGKRVLRGSLWLEPGAATAITSMQHRIADKDWQPTVVREIDKRLPTATSKGRTTYSFEIPMAAGFTGCVQFDVTQNDRFSSHRTFTYQVQG